jgi:hypothetical protein
MLLLLLLGSIYVCMYGSIAGKFLYYDNVGTNETSIPCFLPMQYDILRHLECNRDQMI